MVLWLVLILDAAAGPRCGTPHVMHGAVRPERPAFGGGGTGELAERDEYDLPNVYTTEHFAIRWGDSGSFDLADVWILGDDLEHAWDVVLGDLGYPPPYGSESYLFNVYLGGTGNGAPPTWDFLGYFYWDEKDWPMLVVNPSSLGAPELAAIAGHEFFHAVQDEIDTLLYAASGWYHEATSTWIEGLIAPEDTNREVYLPGFTLLPDLPLDTFVYPDTGALVEYHQYGAFLFVEALAEDDPDRVRRSFVEAPRGGDPMDVLDAQLVEEGTSLGAVYAEMAVRNATWDYPEGERYAQAIEDSGWAWTSASHWPTGIIDGPGTWSPDEPPYAYGANPWLLDGLDPETPITFRALGAPASWSVVLTGRDDAGVWREEVPVVDGVGAVLLPERGAYTDAWLVVTALDPVEERGGPYDHTVEVEGEVDPGPTTTDEPRRCGCQGKRAGLWLPALLLGWRRRRR